MEADGKSQRKSLTFTEYLDGLHPDNTLARIWMKKIVTHMFHYCKWVIHIWIDCDAYCVLT